MRAEYSITELCEALEVSRSGYHRWRGAKPGPRAKGNAVLLEEIREIHRHRHMRAYGSPRMSVELRERGLSCSRGRVARLMRSEGLRARPRRPYRPKTTQPDHGACPSPNLLAQEPPASAPGRQLVSDLTYIPTDEGYLYLVVVMDLFSRAIVGWDLSASMAAQGVQRAFERARARGAIRPGAIFHSDRGSQYSSALVRKALAAPGCRQSMSAKGYCYDNAFAESCFASLKNEMFPDSGRFCSHDHARRAIFDYLETFYNRRRRHSSLGQRSPLQFLELYFQKQYQQLN